MDGYAPTRDELLETTRVRCPDLSSDQQEQVVTLAAALYPKFKEPLTMVKVARYQFNKISV